MYGRTMASFGNSYIRRTTSEIESAVSSINKSFANMDLHNANIGDDVKELQGYINNNCNSILSLMKGNKFR